jgi:outer membrane protein TolC
MISTRKVRHLLASVSMVALLGACAVQPRPLTEAEMKAQAVSDSKEMYVAEAPISKPLTLSDAIARALTHNLDRRTKMMEEALAIGQKDVDRWDLLPKLAANAGYTSRSEANATRSRDAITNVTSTSNPTYSTDRDNVTADLGLTWNILDLGVSYVNAHQTADKALIATERRRKTIHNLIQETRFAYWRTAAAQALETEVQEAVSVAEKALVDARAVEKEGLKSQAEILRYQKNLLENLRQLEAISHELSTAKIELAALINQPPGSEITLDIPADSAMTLPVAVPTEKMEELAFINNPDLREQVYLSRIAVDETKKTILKLLPGINLNATRNWDSNSFLVDNQWYSLGAKLSWNLFNLISAPDQIDQAEAGEKVANAKRVALRMAVLAQVHVSHRQFQNAGKQYLRADELYQVEQRLAQFSRVRAENDAQSVMERIANQTSAIAARLRRYQSYAQMESAYGKMQATLGQDLLPDQVASRDLDSLSAVIAQRLEIWSRGGQAFLAAAPVAEAEVAKPVTEVTPVATNPQPPGEAPAIAPSTDEVHLTLPPTEEVHLIAPPDVVTTAEQVKAKRRTKPLARAARVKLVPAEAPQIEPSSPVVEQAANPVVEWVRPGISDAKWAEIMDKASKLKASAQEEAPPKDTAIKEESPVTKPSPQALRYDLPTASSINLASAAN